MRLRIIAAVLGVGLLFAPHERRVRLAADYAMQAKHLLARSQLMAARVAYQRALELAPDAPSAPALRAQLQFINTELALTLRR